MISENEFIEPTTNTIAPDTTHDHSNNSDLLGTLLYCDLATSHPPSVHPVSTAVEQDVRSVLRAHAPRGNGAPDAAGVFLLWPAVGREEDRHGAGR